MSGNGWIGGWILPLSLAWRETRGHFLRSAVTATAVFLGVASLLVMTALSRGMEAQNREMYLRMGGAQVIQVTATKATDALQDASFARSRGLRLSDVDVLRQNLPQFDGWVPEVSAGMGRISLKGARVRAIYTGLARQFGVEWQRRKYDPGVFDAADIPNRCLSVATSCLYGLTEAAVLAAGYAPSVGFLHSGKPLSFVYDMADIFKFDTVVPVAFRIAAQQAKGKLDMPVEMAVRHACRDSFRQSQLLSRLIPSIEQVLLAGEIAPPEEPEYVVGPAFEDEPPTGDPGMR